MPINPQSLVHRLSLIGLYYKVNDAYIGLQCKEYEGLCSPHLGRFSMPKSLKLNSSWFSL